jgi:copper(I)-binding protein
MEMHAVPGLDCPPGATVTAHPNGVHAMLFGLTKPLIAGTIFSMAMQFRDAGTLSVPVEVRTEPVAR